MGFRYTEATQYQYSSEFSKTTHCCSNICIIALFLHSRRSRQFIIKYFFAAGLQRLKNKARTSGITDNDCQGQNGISELADPMPMHKQLLSSCCWIDLSVCLLSFEAMATSLLAYCALIDLFCIFPLLLLNFLITVMLLWIDHVFSFACFDSRQCADGVKPDCTGRLSTYISEAEH